ncbi:stalk domain-containing protein [Cohnella rhizosphaerae]|uniref:Stalk domain-containing protein n=1 Tax=Cohnella rhizosphaerae TaxID=1457232 RepID=A0A9X4QU80_9BACL|nr:stalk domain-containing protein [Cohnella rhizosphaerae]MDG0811991.1 stalk domain-containing protein [Cohnella rhizosphaerae]
MKKAIAATILAAALGTAAAGTAGAAQASSAVSGKSVTAKTAALTVKQSVFVVNYNEAQVRTVLSNGETLVSVRDLVAAIGAKLSTVNGYTTVTLDSHSFAFKTGVKQASVDGSIINLNQAAKVLDGTSFVAVKPFVQALGGTMALKDGKLAINTIKLLAGGENARFVNAGQAIVSVESDTKRTDYLVDVATGKSAELLSSEGGSDLVVAPGGAMAAYTDAEGAVYAIDLASKQTKQITGDTSIKTELAWSADGSAIYFLQGDKGSVIAKVDVATGTISKVVEDKVDYKSALSVSPDGKRFAYLVTTPPKATADGTDLDKDTVAIDASGEQVQVNLFDTTAEKPAAVALTSAKDDKLFVVSPDGSVVYYVSVADENANATVVSVDKDKKTATLLAEGDVEELVLSGGKLYALTAVSDAQSAIYEIDPATASKKLLYNVPASASGLAVNGSQMIIALEDGLYVNANGTWKPIAR